MYGDHVKIVVGFTLKKSARYKEIQTQTESERERRDREFKLSTVKNNMNVLLYIPNGIE